MEFISKYMRIIKSVLWVLIIVFAYKVYGSINGPIEFNKVKEYIGEYKNNKFYDSIKNFMTIKSKR